MRNRIINGGTGENSKEVDKEGSVQTGRKRIREGKRGVGGGREIEIAGR